MPEKEITLTLRLRDIATENLKKTVSALQQFKGTTGVTASVATKSFEGVEKSVANVSARFKGTQKQLDSFTARGAELEKQYTAVPAPIEEATQVTDTFGIRMRKTATKVADGMRKVSKFSAKVGKDMKGLAWMFTWATLSMLGVVWQLNAAMIMMMGPLSRLFSFFMDFETMISSLASWIAYSAIAGVDLTAVWASMGIGLEDFVTTGLEFKGLVSAIMGILAGFGLIFIRELIPYLRQFLEKLLVLAADKEFIKWLQDVAKGFGEFIVKLTEFLTTDPSKITKAVEGTLKGFQTMMGGTLKATSSLVNLLPIPDEMKGAFSGLTDMMSQTAPGAEGVGIAIAQIVAIGLLLVPVVTLMMTVLAPLSSLLVAVGLAFSFFSMGLNSILAIPGIIKFLTSLAGGSVAVGAEAGTMTLSMLGLVAALIAIVAVFVIFLVELYKVSPEFREFCSVVGQGIILVGKDLYEAIKLAALGFATFLTLVSAAGAAFGTFLSWVYAVGAGFGSFISKADAAWRQLKWNIEKGISDLISGAWNWGAELIQNFIDGILSMFGKVGDTLRSLADEIWKFIGFGSVPIAGALKDVPNWGLSLSEEFMRGIEGGMRALTIPVPGMPAGVGVGAGAGPAMTTIYVTQYNTNYVAKTADVDEVTAVMAKDFAYKMRK